MTVLAAMGCDSTTPDGGDDGSTPDELEVPRTYEFDSRFEDGSSVSYTGQVLRHVLIGAMKDHLGGMTARIDDGSFAPVEGDVVAELDYYYTFESAIGGEQPHGFEMAMPALQATFDDISSGKDLQGKLAGNDETGQHVDWNTGFVGYAGAANPESLVQLWFADVEGLAIARAQGEPALDPLGNPIEAVYVSPEGRDYQQLLQKFLLGAITFSQGTDDYLDDDLEGKGLLSDNVEPDEDKPATALEHGWDEAFGYFGAARDYLEYTDDEIAGADGRPGYADGYHDTNGDGMLDLTREYNFGHSVNAAKRDRGANASAATDFSTAAMEAFLTGRAIITHADGPLTDEQMADLKEQRDIAVANWENAIASTVVHYINDVLGDMNAIGTTDYSFGDHAKHWSELKGFALSLQFNPRSPLSNGDFAQLHTLIGDAPTLPDGDVDGYRAALLQARTLLGNAYGFAPENLGNELGEGGW